MKIAALPRSCGGAISGADRAGCENPVRSLPRRHRRSRKKGARTPEGVIYCGRPTVRGNPFDWRRFGHARSVKLYRLWIEGKLGVLRLEQLGFGAAEIDALIRWRRRMLPELDRLRGVDLQCWCAEDARWCHVDVIIEKANAAPPVPPLDFQGRGTARSVVEGPSHRPQEIAA